MMGLTVPGMGKQAIVDMIYPVGSIYMSTVKITPAAVFGGEWEPIRGKFLLAEGDTHVAGSTGGEETHALTEAENGPHSHVYANKGGNVNPAGPGNQWYATSTYNNPYAPDTTALGTQSSGQGAPHNNMPPYLAVYVWKRIA